MVSALLILKPQLAQTCYQKEALEPTSLFSVFMKRQPSENSLVFQQATNDNRGEEESMPVALMILIPILSSGLILIILTVVCIRR